MPLILGFIRSARPGKGRASFWITENSAYRIFYAVFCRILCSRPKISEKIFRLKRGNARDTDQPFLPADPSAGLRASLGAEAFSPSFFGARVAGGTFT